VLAAVRASGGSLTNRGLVWMGLIALSACGKGGDTDPATGDTDDTDAVAAAACPALTAQDVVGRSWTFAYTADYSAANDVTGGYTQTVTSVTPDGADALDLVITQEWATDSAATPDYTETRTYTSLCDGTGQHTLAAQGDWSYTLGNGTASGSQTWEYTDPPDFPIAGGDYHDDVIGTFTDLSTTVQSDIEAHYDYVAAEPADVITPAGTFTAVRFDWTDAQAGATGYDWRVDGTGRVATQAFELTAFASGE
jgi:hypothetical protein